eukprot:1918943-Karenia_brevis.AAC.1
MQHPIYFHGTRWERVDRILRMGCQLEPGPRQANRAGKRNAQGEHINPGVWRAVREKAYEYALPCKIPG